MSSVGACMLTGLLTGGCRAPPSAVCKGPGINPPCKIACILSRLLLIHTCLSLSLANILNAKRCHSLLHQHTLAKQDDVN